MEDVSGKGLSIATDQAILSLHQDLTALHIQLLQQIDETQEKKCERERERQLNNNSKYTVHDV